MSAPDRSPHLLDVVGLAKRLGGRQVVSDVSLALRRGEVLAFVGANGAGKTTTLRLLAGLLKPDSGSGHVLGHALGRDRRAVAARVGYMPQRLALYDDLTVYDNLKFRAELHRLPRSRQRIDEVLVDFCLQDRRRERAGHLSGGWARRLQLAATLIHSPQLLMLDEPTAGLDAISRQDVWRRIICLGRAGVAVLVNTHDLGEAEQCDTVALFEDGRIVARGSPADLAATADLAALWVESANVGRLRAIVEALPNVVAAEMQSGQLRLLVKRHGVEAVREGVRQAGAMTRLAPPLLADATFNLRGRARDRAVSS